MRVIIGHNNRRLGTILSHFLRMTPLFIVLYFSLFQTHTVYAHSTLLEMEPAERILIENPPSVLKLRFNEPIEHDLAIVTIYDWNAKPVFTGNPDGNIKRSPLLEFSLPELKQGTYSVKWNVISADGHPVSGSYAFSVGKSTEGGFKSLATDTSSEAGLIAARVIVEGLLLLGAGLFWFTSLAERRKFPSLDSLWKRGRRIGAIVLVLGTIVELITYGLSLPPGIIQVIFNGKWELLPQFTFILMLSVQLFFLILLFVPGMVQGWYLTLWLALAVTPAFGGHVWGMEHPVVALIFRMIHQLTIAFWLGALGYLILLLIWQKKQNALISWKEFRPFFVQKMLIASALVFVSGVIMVFLQTGITAVFTHWMAWSTVVIIKVILTITMLGLALFQTVKWKKADNFVTIRWIQSEWVVGLIVIVLGVWASQIAYPIAVQSYNKTLVTDQIEAQINIVKLETGYQKMTAKISELDDKQPEEVSVKITMLQHDMGSTTFKAKRNDRGEYVVDLPFSMSGSWLFEVSGKYPGGEKKKWEDEIFIASDGK